MSITRAPRPESNFYILDKRISEDSRLSWGARGLLIFLLGKPDSWNISISHLRDETKATAKPTGRDGIYGLLDELIGAGYVIRSQERIESGGFSSNAYIVHESPLPENPYTANPYTANPTLVSIDLDQGLKKTKPCHPQADDIPFDEIFDTYNRVCGKTFKGAIALTPKRKANIKTLFHLKICNQKPFKEKGLQFWEAYFSDCLQNAHWRGQNDRGWKADLEFLTRPEIATKMLESTLQ